MPEYAAMVHLHPRPRTRDFFDIHHTVNHFAIDLAAPANIDTLRNIFAAKKVPLDSLRKVRCEKDFHAQEFDALKATIRSEVDLKEFGFYFDYVVDLCERLADRFREGS
jgi:hypothetical protein